MAGKIIVTLGKWFAMIECCLFLTIYIWTQSQDKGSEKYTVKAIYAELKLTVSNFTREIENSFLLVSILMGHKVTQSMFGKLNLGTSISNVKKASNPGI